MKNWLKQPLQNYNRDQSKKNFNDMPWCTPTKSEEIDKTEGTFLTGEMNHMVLQEELPTELEYNPFWKPNNWQA